MGDNVKVGFASPEMRCSFGGLSGGIQVTKNTQFPIKVFMTTVLAPLAWPCLLSCAEYLKLADHYKNRVDEPQIIKKYSL